MGVKSQAEHSCKLGMVFWFWSPEARETHTDRCVTLKVSPSSVFTGALRVRHGTLVLKHSLVQGGGPWSRVKADRLTYHKYCGLGAGAGALYAVRWVLVWICLQLCKPVSSSVNGDMDMHFLGHHWISQVEGSVYTLQNPEGMPGP